MGLSVDFLAESGKKHLVAAVTVDFHVEESICSLVSSSTLGGVLGTSVTDCVLALVVTLNVGGA